MANYKSACLFLLSYLTLQPPSPSFIAAFQPTTSLHIFPQSQRTNNHVFMTNNNDNLSSPETSRRNWMTNILIQSSAALPLIVANPNQAEASVFVDPDRYGDKELKIATVNKIRQNVRNAITTDPSFATTFLQIAIMDALSYDPSTQENGPDGSIVRTIMDSKAADPKFKQGAEKLQDIAKLIKRTTEITMADVVTFAGAEAIESVGGPRIVVQLGKLDPKKSSAKAPTVVDITNGKEVLQNFSRVGLTEREVALLYGAMGSMDVIAQSYKASDDLDDEPNEMGDVEVFIPSSFGAPSQIYGKQLGVMDNSYFKAILKNKSFKNTVFEDDKVMQWTKKYADNKAGFLKDLPEAYGKLMALGTRYTGGKVGNLLGQSDSDV